MVMDLFQKSANMICKNSRFLALNAQVNASNIGYHTIRNYNNFDTLIINEKEIRHEMRDKANKLEILMSNLSREKNKKYNCYSWRQRVNFVC